MTEREAWQEWMDADKAVDKAYRDFYEAVLEKSKKLISWESQLEYILERMEGKGVERWNAYMKNLYTYDRIALEIKNEEISRIVRLQHTSTVMHP